VFGGSFTLHGLEVEPFCVRVIAVTLKRQKITLSHHRREDLLSYAIAELWVVSRKYDPGRYRDFRQFAGRSQPAQGRPLAQSRPRTFDVALRNSYVYERERPQFVSLDAAAEGDRLAPSRA
jgi:hypothetical protein